MSDLSQIVQTSRAAQGLPLQVEDDAAISRIATLIVSAGLLNEESRASSARPSPLPTSVGSSSTKRKKHEHRTQSVA